MSGRRAGLVASGLALLARPAGLSRNALFSLLQALVVTLSYFLAYRIAVAEAGLANLGIWSLVLAGSAVVRIGDVSGGGALARYVALAQHAPGGTGKENDASARGETAVAGRPAETLHTVTLTGIALNGILTLALWLAAPAVIAAAIAPDAQSLARELLPWMLLIFFSGGIAPGLAAAIDGAQRADLRAIMMIAASAMFLGLCYALIPVYGIYGFAMAQALQQGVIVLLAWMCLRRLVPGIGWLPLRWRLDIFRETTGYALRQNVISGVYLLIDPLMKFSLNTLDGPALVALYELANRLVVQLRSLVVALFTPAVPALVARREAAGRGDGDRDGNAASNGASDETLGAFHTLLYRMQMTGALAAIGVCLAALAAAPVVSLLVLGTFDPVLLTLCAMLAGGWSLTVLGLGFYYGGQAVGVLRWNLLSYALIPLSVVIGYNAVAAGFGWRGLVLSATMGMALSVPVQLFGNARVFAGRGVLARSRAALLASAATVVLAATGAFFGFALL